MKLSFTAYFLLIYLAFGFSQDAQAQGRYAILAKNSNVAAKSLKHDLNSSGDTLKLSSSGLIHRVYTAGKTRGLVDVIVNRKRFDLPLKELTGGKHIFVVQDLSRKIIFQVFIYERRNDYTLTGIGD